MSLLEKLYVSGNNLKGNLENFKMDNLSVLNINSNRFTGTLSQSFKAHAFTVVDISTNRITGYFDIRMSNGKMVHAAVNRLSGPLKNSVIETFQNVDILSGNSMSCDTLPKNDISYSDNLLLSNECETRALLSAIVVWCFTLSVVVIIVFVYNKRVVNDLFIWFRLYKNIFHVDTVRLGFPNTIQMIVSFEKFSKLIVLISVPVVILLLFLYIGFEVSENSNTLYKTQFEKYNYAFSGVFLKSVSPAFALLGIFVTTCLLFVYIIYRTFFLDWAVLANAHLYLRQIKSIKYAINRYWIFIVLVWICFSFLINIGYVILLSQTVYTFPLQIGYVVCTSLYFTYGGRGILHHIRNKGLAVETESAWFFAIILTFSCVVNPCLASLVVDRQCFRDLIFGRSEIRSEYTLPYCGQFNLFTDECDKFDELQRSSSFTPNFVYSHSCRDVVLSNFIPAVLISCAFNTFILPLWYLYKTRNIQDLHSQTVIWGFVYDNKDLIFENDLVYLFLEILFDLVLILLFGIAYPFCFVMLILNFISRTYMLIRRVHLYLHLYNNSLTNNFEVDNSARLYLERMVVTVVQSSPYSIWPGLAAVCVLFGTYLFDMAWDNTDEELGLPITLFVLNCVFFVVVCFYFFRTLESVKFELALRQLSFQSSRDSTIELRVTENPIISPSQQAQPQLQSESQTTLVSLE